MPLKWNLSKTIIYNLPEKRKYTNRFKEWSVYHNIKYYGTEEDYNVLVLDLLGRSLQDLFKDCGGRFNLKTVLMLLGFVVRIHTFAEDHTFCIWTQDSCRMIVVCLRTYICAQPNRPLATINIDQYKNMGRKRTTGIGAF